LKIIWVIPFITSILILGVLGSSNQLAEAATTCSLPNTGDWIVSSTCTVMSNQAVSGSITVSNGVVLTIPNGVTLSINFATNNLTVQSGGGVLVKAGGTIHDPPKPTISISSLPPQHSAYSTYFTKYVNVFGVNIFASTNTADSKVLHAANVMAEYLDNDADGIQDNPGVVSDLVANNSFLFMFADENEQDTSGFFDDETLPENVCNQNLFGFETNPVGAFDASLEEVLHLITHCGYATTYPTIFDEVSGTTIANFMDTARGGHFETIPTPYPNGAWYTYGDVTCEYNCQITEYFYWSLTSILGAQENRLDDIQDEWTLNTATKVQTTDSNIYNLLTNPIYRLATILPDGNY